MALPQSAQQGRQSDNALTFFNLPTEIHFLVFDYIECIEDLICLGLTNEYFWTLAQPHLDDYYMSLLGTWSGKNIVCVGDDVEPDDYPAHLFSAKELDTLRPLRNNVLRGNPSWPYMQCNTPFALSHFADPSVSDVQDFVDPRTEAWRLLQHCKSLGKGKDPAFAEFVRAEPIAIRPEYIHGARILVVGFGEVVMLRTCWSSASSDVCINNTISPPRGVWAGHRFDITTLASHENDIDSAGWADVSDEVAREISEVWHYESGDDIREHLVVWYPKRPIRGFFFDDRPPYV
ncbi:hypothetical protein GGR51DRAFT_561790 [Nemania sp. FL0031]|nr:hypothetical protein GGR51DRAFT_561790 [Nemania sp. FL0031]